MSNLLTKQSRVVVLTGAGISAESGLKTFRDNDGLWENHSIEEVATPEAFARNPDLVYRFYNQRRAQLTHGEVYPNEGHKALAKLEAQLGDRFLLVTQNVDNLHELAGSQRVLHMHGDLLSYRCCRSGQVVETTAAYDRHSRCDCCTPANSIRPNIVWFGEMPMHMEQISSALENADYFISIGTSGSVYPAAGFVKEANYYGAHTVELNLEPSSNHYEFSQSYYGLASDVIPQYVEQLIG
ncbi:Sir2 family NAD+-dependent deacetylase [Aliiglaciecola litoralis]|uniref:NAD-dependent protein deacylase n=1 Tax=Aliiglaciecola litoralis TaxID=582857 RepID=A0ABP3WNC3_9ALTE